MITTTQKTVESVAARCSLPEEPWPYKKLDPAATAAIACEEWYRVFCGAAVINSVFSQLREKVGEPYLSFPVDSFVFLEGGMAGWDMTCGSNAGAAIVADIITCYSDHFTLVSLSIASRQPHAPCQNTLTFAVSSSYIFLL